MGVGRKGYPMGCSGAWELSGAGGGEGGVKIAILRKHAAFA